MYAHCTCQAKWNEMTSADMISRPPPYTQLLYPATIENWLTADELTNWPNALRPVCHTQSTDFKCVAHPMTEIDADVMTTANRFLHSNWLHVVPSAHTLRQRSNAIRHKLSPPTASRARSPSSVGRLCSIHVQAIFHFSVAFASIVAYFDMTLTLKANCCLHLTHRESPA